MVKISRSKIYDMTRGARTKGQSPGQSIGFSGRPGGARVSHCIIGPHFLKRISIFWNYCLKSASNRMNFLTNLTPNTVSFHLIKERGKRNIFLPYYI